MHDIVTQFPSLLPIFHQRACLALYLLASRTYAPIATTTSSVQRLASLLLSSLLVVPSQRLRQRVVGPSNPPAEKHWIPQSLTAIPTMSGFFDLPREVRDMIYHQTVRDRKVKFVTGLRVDKGKSLRRSSAASLLVCSKKMYTEYAPIFYAQSRLDITSVADIKGATLKYGWDLGLLQNLKIGHPASHDREILRFLKALPNLQRLTFYTNATICLPHATEIMGWHDEDVGDYDEIDFDWCLDDDEGVGLMMRSYIESEVEEYPGRLVGQCSDQYGCCSMYGECHAESVTRKLIAAWEWNDQPFELITSMEIESMDAGQPSFVCDRLRCSALV